MWTSSSRQEEESEYIDTDITDEVEEDEEDAVTKWVEETKIPIGHKIQLFDEDKDNVEIAAPTWKELVTSKDLIADGHLTAEYTMVQSNMRRFESEDQTMTFSGLLGVKAQGLLVREAADGPGDSVDDKEEPSVVSAAVWCLLDAKVKNNTALSEGSEGRNGECHRLETKLSAEAIWEAIRSGDDRQQYGLTVIPGCPKSGGLLDPRHLRSFKGTGWEKRIPLPDDTATVVSPMASRYPVDLSLRLVLSLTPTHRVDSSES